VLETSGREPHGSRSAMATRTNLTGTTSAAEPEGPVQAPESAVAGACASSSSVAAEAEHPVQERAGAGREAAPQLRNLPVKAPRVRCGVWR